VVRKIHVASLPQVDKNTGGYQLTEFRGVEFSKIFHIFTVVSRLVLLHFIQQAQLNLRLFTLLKISSFSSFQQFEQIC
jgi:hypothetical protein